MLTMRRRALSALGSGVLLATLLSPAPMFAAEGPPVASPQTLRTPVSTDLPILLTAHDPEGIVGNVLIYLTTAPAHGSVAPPDGTMTCTGGGKNCQANVTYTPETGYRGADSFTFTVTDAELPTPETSAPATISITVNGVPTANGDPSAACSGSGRYLATEDTQLIVTDGVCDVLTNDTDLDDDPLTAVLATDVTMGTLSLAADGTFTYDPDPDVWSAAGTTTDSFTYRASDGFELSPPATVAINVAAVNDDPSFTKGANQTVDEDAGPQTVAGWATSISSGPNESDTLTFEITANNNSGLFQAGPAVSAAGTLTYTPAANANGSASISLRLDDNAGGITATQSFTITVDAVNDAPTFTKGANQSVEEGSGAVSVTGWATNISPGPTDEAGQIVSFSVVGNTNPALFSGGPSVSASTGTLTYTVASGVSGSSTITLRLTDNGGTANGGVNVSQQTFTIAVGLVNDPPSFTKGANQSVLEDAGAISVPSWATSISQGEGDTGQTLSFEVTGDTNTALFSGQPAVSSSGALTFTPAANKNGSATITLVLTDDGGGTDTSAPASFTITITAVNDAPNAANDVGITINQNAAAVPIPVLANDSTLPDTGETLHVVSVTAPGHGTATITGGGIGVSYTPAPTYRGSDLFTYVVSDGGRTDTATVLLDVIKAGTVTRLAGADRYATSAAISKASYAAGVSVVYIASGTGFADALSGAPVAGKLGGPILLVSGTSIPTVIRTELSRLKPAKIVILGGTGVVSSGVATSLDAYTSGPVTRLSGADRYATSAAISKANYAANVPVAYIASGLGFTDALSGAPAASKLGGPILLVPGTSIPTVIRTELSRLKPAKIVILGGTGVVSAGVASALDAYTTGAVSRLAGADRYATSAAISKANYATHVSVVFIASGTGFADALSGAPVAGKLGGPILLVPGTSIPAVIAAELIRLKPAKIVILGGTGVVSAGVGTSLGFYTTAS
jgi:VCBS repeat-containing protein